jgi:hypothetical protein
MSANLPDETLGVSGRVQEAVVTRRASFQS